MSTPLLQVSELSIRYGEAQSAPGVDRIGFSVRTGEVVALIGESGSGKSTIANSLLGLLPSAASIRSGSILLAGRELTKIGSAREWQQIRGKTVTLVPQDPNTALNPVKRVGGQMTETLKLHGVPGTAAEHRARVEELLASVGIDDPARVVRSYPHELSGGMKQRALIATALSTEPRLVIADEPTSGLDVTVQRLVLDQVRDLARERGVAVILITHDLAVAQQYADRIVVLRAGRIVEEVTPSSLFAGEIDPYTKLLFDAAPSFSTARLRASDGASAIEPNAAPQPPAAPQALLEVRQLRKVFGRGGRNTPSEHAAVDEVTFVVPRGTTYGLVGQSGSGKSTTARIVAGLETATGGSVLFDGEDIATASRTRRRLLSKEVQYIFQNPYSSLDPYFTIERVVAEPLAGFTTDDKATISRRVDEYLDAVEIPRSYRRRRPSELSGGQRQRVAIARALTISPRLLVLDEPVSALDVSVQATILQLLVDLQAEFGLTYIFISHDLAVIRLISDYVGVLHRGRLVDDGPADRVFDAPSSEHTKALIDAVILPPALGLAGTGR